MKVQIRDREALSSLSCLNLRAHLTARQWVAEGEYRDRATIFTMDYDGRKWEILCPHRDSFADYAERMAEAVATLAIVEDRSQLDVFHDLSCEKKTA